MSEADLFIHAIDRTVGAPPIHGNAVRLLRDAAENYPAWLAAIQQAQRYIYFESYIIHDDDVGHEFADALIARAAQGVTVRVIYDWLGAFGKSRRRFWRRLEQGGVVVRCYNPPRILSPLSWLRRDHRKLLSVDGRVCFITGLCVGQPWAGDPARGVPPWRDTGVEIRGPAVAAAEQTFARLWGQMGTAIPQDEPLCGDRMQRAGDTVVRVVATTPGAAGLLRLDQMIAASANQRLWLSDAYFAGIPSYVQGLASAARDGVDVRLLVPGASDIAVLRPISQTGYRPLLESGVRVFEWKGPMMHAKTAVADGRWARVGSSNLNISSWLGNHELDAVIPDVEFARQMEQMYLEDLENATEIVLPLQRRARLRNPREYARGSAARAAASALRMSHTIGDAITDRRPFTSTEATMVGASGVAFIILAVLAAFVPLLITIPLAVLGSWFGIVLLARAVAIKRRERAAARRRRLPG
jgi:cardiolipin synthase